MTILIEVRRLTKRYRVGDEEILALCSLDMSVGKNEYVAVTGSSGSGKSTLMNIIGCLDKQSEGDYRLAGEDVSRLSDTALSAIRNRQIGFVFQNFCLMPRMSALENVMQPLMYREMSRVERRGRASDALQRVGLANRGKHLPAELSGGQRQRVAIARALITNPSILLADEPTGNLDAETATQILAMFDDLHSGGQTVIVVTHDLQVAQHCHRQISLVNGKIVADVQR